MSVTGLLPVGSPAQSGPPRTVAALIQSIESMFHCVQGPPRAYFEMRIAPAQASPVMRCLYSSLKYATRGPRQDVEPMLVQAMHDDFKAVLAQYASRHDAVEDIQDGIKPILFWRRIPEIEETAPEQAGVDANGSWIEGRPYYQTALRCRFFIPGVEPFNDSGTGTVYLREVV